MLRAVALTLTCTALVLGAAACGSESGSSGGADPATLAPAGAPVYLQAAVQPTGDRREDALAAAGKLLQTDDPAGRLRELVNAELADAELSWERDFAPWIGEEAGIWAGDLERDEPTFALIVATSDAEAAEAALARFRESGGGTVTERSHAGSDYAVSGDDEASGIVGDFVVFGTEAGFKRTAEIADDGESLADSERYGTAVGELEDGRLGHYYMDAGRLLDAALEQDPQTAAQFRQFRSLLPLDELGPITGAFSAGGEGMTLDTVLTGVPEGPFRDLAALWSSDEPGLMAELPGDAWAAYAVPRLGETASRLFSSIAGPIGGAAIAGQIRSATGLDLQDDVFAWIGDAGLYVSGTTASDLGGALVIATTDDAKAATAFTKLVGLIGRETGSAPAPVRVDGAEAAFALAPPGATQKLVLARGQGRVVAASGVAMAAAALDPDAELADADAYAEAADALGGDMQPTLLLSVSAALALADAMRATDADFDAARPYVEALGVVAAGGSAEEDTLRSRIAVTLK